MPKRRLARFDKDVGPYFDLCECWCLRFLLLADPKSAVVENLFEDCDLGRLVRLQLPAERKDAFKSRGENRRRFRERLSAIEPQVLPGDSVLVRNIATLADRLSASPIERTVLAFVVLLNAVEPFYNCVNHISERCTNEAFIYGAGHMLDVGEDDLRKALSRDGILIQSKLLNFQHTIENFEDKVTLRERLGSVLLTRHESDEALFSHFFRKSDPARLQAHDFPHLSQDWRIIRDYGLHALREKKKGVNILLHGPPGVGKTQFARGLGAKLSAYRSGQRR